MICLFTNEICVKGRESPVAPPTEHPIHPGPVVTYDDGAGLCVPQDIVVVAEDAHSAPANMHQHPRRKIEEQEADHTYVLPPRRNDPDCTRDEER